MSSFYSSPGQSTNANITSNEPLSVTNYDQKHFHEPSHYQAPEEHNPAVYYEYPENTTTPHYTTSTPLLNSSSSHNKLITETNHDHIDKNHFNKDNGSERSSSTSVEGSAVSEIKPVSLMRMIFIGMVTFGLECIWALQYVYATPILQGLNLPSFLVSYAWIFSPLAAVFWSPIVGCWSDRTKSRFGKRKPFILVGCIAVVIAATGLTTSPSLYSSDGDSVLPRGLVITIAIMSIFFMDLSAKSVEGLARALVVDCVPDSQIEKANSVMTAFLCLGSSSGYVIGSLDISSKLPHFLSGLSNLQCQYILTVMVFMPTMIITLVSAREVNTAEGKEENVTIDDYHQQTDDPELNANPSRDSLDNSDNDSNHSRDTSSPSMSVFGVLLQMGKAVIRMPRPIAIISLQQLFSWGGLWVLWLFGTTWMGTAIFHGNPSSSNNSDQTNAAAAAAILGINGGGGVSPHQEYERGVRFGSLAFSTMAAVAGITAPMWSILTRKIGTRYVMLAGIIANIICLSVMIITGAGVIVPSSSSHSRKINSIIAIIAQSGCGLPWSALMTSPYVVVGSLVGPEDIGLFSAVVFSCTILSQLVIALTVGPIMTWVGTQAWIGDEAYSVALVVGIVASTISIVFTLLSRNLKK
eukprot:gb/GECH01007134.1/.p1 GENE.gb/GECH01007134.1/~~gb/GECH01007134.1/.p1  ORF type:complete len:637 (+),score=75.05 gb/GECH01007134.1/:1-1911(+)